MPKVKTHEIRQNWSNFIPEDGNIIAKKRLRLMNLFSNTKVKNRAGNYVGYHWRLYIGDVLIELMKQSNPEELATLMVKKKYLDLQGFIRVASTFGLNKAQAEERFAEITLESKS